MSLRRRDVLLFRIAPTGGRSRSSCRQCRLRTVDAQCGVSEEKLLTMNHRYEPPLVRERETPEQLIRNLNRELGECRMLRVVDANGSARLIFAPVSTRW
jgi:hypothetical protein